MVGVFASVNLPLHHKVQKFSSGTGSPGWSQKRAVKRLWCVCGGWRLWGWADFVKLRLHCRKKEELVVYRLASVAETQRFMMVQDENTGKKGKKRTTAADEQQKDQKFEVG